MSESMDAKNIYLAELDRVYNAMPEMDDNFYAGYQLAAFILRNFPKVEVATVRRGHWIFKRQYHDADECNCSNCGQLMTTAHGVRMPYCPQCGFIMDGGADNG